MLSSLVLIFATQTIPALAPVSVDNDYRLDAQQISQPLISDANLDVLETGRRASQIRISQKLELEETGRRPSKIRISQKLKLEETGRRASKIRI